MSNEIPVLNSRTAYVKAIDHPGLTVLEGTATWCTQCKAIAPEVQKMVSEFPDVKFFTYDVEETPDIAQELGVSRMPTFSLFRDGDIQEGVSGARAAELRKVIRGYVDQGEKEQS
ncbi:thioredoxin-like protein [Pleomassaria siparia CBS 279.74]|uniref:Thioredoxin-like protein n=1 Tax=Pleomassaria siparia CBS 279.74 TaxID=1314801 RepID=A0A6G1KGQ2_9PLEO|nr:thioredoxin-like protein [Pleomassaria siparia CBS 279.74]